MKRFEDFMSYVIVFLLGALFCTFVLGGLLDDAQDYRNLLSGSNVYVEKDNCRYVKDVSSGEIWDSKCIVEEK